MPNKEFKILCIDGGGIKGLFSSKVLEHLEQENDCHISDYFDMIAGTSTGGLLALGLSLKIKASDISDLYIDNGASIFPRNSLFGGFVNVFFQLFWGGRYDNTMLRITLKKIFGSKKIKDSNNLLCIPSYIITEDRPRVFKYDHKEGNLDRDNEVSYVDVALATSAAPTYLPVVEISNFPGKQFIDGGVWGNNPCLVALIEALDYFVGPDKEYRSIKILSISSISPKNGEISGKRKSRSFLGWRDKLFEVSLNGQNSFTDYFMQKISSLSTIDVDYYRIKPPVIPMNQLNSINLDRTDQRAIDQIISKGDDVGQREKHNPRVKVFFETKKTYNLTS